MTEGKALILVCVGGLLLGAGCTLGLAALGVAGVGLSLGAIVPMALTVDGVTRVVMHYGESGRSRR